MSISALKNFTENTEKMPVLFMGHGNPMNAIEDNVFTRGWKQMVKDIPTPKAILCISAHWETNGAKVLSSAQPRMIYDMYGFPQKLYQVKYPAVGSPELAKEVSSQVKFTNVALDDTWGFDHGTWSVLVHAFPDADIPCFQLSLNKTRNMKWHYDLAKELTYLRSKGVLIVGSGNIVHNLSNFKALFDKTPDWALEFDKKSTELILDDNHSALLDYKQFGKSALLSVNSAEHYIPMLYAISQKEKGDSIQFFNHDIHENLMATGMRSIRIG
ncbi:MAG: 4,5-DOPA dioxygenase extradiol [Bacteroidia bacterium]